MYKKMFNRLKVMKYFLKCNCHTVSDYTAGNIQWDEFMQYSHKKKLDVYFQSAPHLRDSQQYIPDRYLDGRQKPRSPDKLYLVDTELAAKIAEHIVPEILQYKNTMVCETNPGLGYLTSELLKRGVPKLRLYETCPEFRKILRGFSKAYPGQVDVLLNDIFQIWKLSYIDKLDKGNRVGELLKDVPRKDWTDDPCLIIVGTMPKLDFINYLMQAIAFQSELSIHGRVELYVVIRPGDYLKLTAGPHQHLYRSYQRISVLFNTFCIATLLAKLPRAAFIPWEPTVTTATKRKTIRKHDINRLYLVRIELKKFSSLKPEQRLPFYYFVKQFFGTGSARVIPKLEQWISDIGSDVIAPESSYNIDKNIGIYTKSGELTPKEILTVFQILYDHSGYATSSFAAMVEAELLKYETVDTDLAELHKTKSQ